MNHNINDVVLYKTYNKNGEVIRFGANAPEVRKIIRFVPNTKNENVIEWSSSRGQGACMQSIWEEWQDSVNEGQRRGRENED